MFLAAALMVVPAAGVGVVIVVLEGICNGIYRMYRPAMEKMNLEEEKKDYHLAECEWDEKTPDAPWKNKEECERRIHYFKGVKDKEELEKSAFRALTDLPAGERICRRCTDTKHFG